MHLVPLPFGKIFMQIDGGMTKNKETWTGPIGKKFNQPNEKYPPLQNFDPISGHVTATLASLKDMNKDMQLMFLFALAVQSGYCDPDLLKRLIGHVHKARWHNQVTSILKQWVTSSNPSQKLYKLTRICVMWYVPFIQRIREYWRLEHGAPNFFYGLQLAKECFNVSTKTS